MAIIRMLKWISSACDDNAIFLTREIHKYKFIKHKFSANGPI